MRDDEHDIFLRIAVDRGFLEPARADAVRGVVAAEGRGPSEAAMSMGLLTEKQVRGIERGVRYYRARSADKLFGKAAVEHGVAAAAVEDALRRQKEAVQRWRTMPRLAKLLRDAGALDAATERRIRAMLAQRAGSAPQGGAAAPSAAIPTLVLGGAQREAAIDTAIGEPGAAAASAPEAETEAPPEVVSPASADEAQDPISSEDLEELAEDLDRSPDPDELPGPVLKASPRPVLRDHEGFHLPERPAAEGAV